MNRQLKQINWYVVVVEDVRIKTTLDRDDAYRSEALAKESGLKAEVLIL